MLAARSALLLLPMALAIVLATRGDAAPTDAAARLVPPDALLYAHLSTSDSRTQDARLLRGRRPLRRRAKPRPGARHGADARRRRPGLRARRPALARRRGRRRAARRRPAGPEPLLLAAVGDRAAAAARARPARCEARRAPRRHAAAVAAAARDRRVRRGPPRGRARRRGHAARSTAPPATARPRSPTGAVFRRAAQGRDGAVEPRPLRDHGRPAQAARRQPPASPGARAGCC